MVIAIVNYRGNTTIERRLCRRDEWDGRKKTRLLFQLIIDPFVLSFIENHSIHMVAVSRFVERGLGQQFLDHLFDTRLTFIMSSNVCELSCVFSYTMAQ